MTDIVIDNPSSYIEAGTGSTMMGANFTINSASTGIYYSTGENWGGDSSFKNDDKFKVKTHQDKRGVKKKRGAKPEKGNPPEFSPLLIFRIIKKRFSLLEGVKLNKRLEQISKCMSEIPKDQVALTEEFETIALRVMREAEMASCGFNKYLEKESLDAFVKRAKNRVIKITKMKNYARFIPKRVRDKMEKAKKKKLFDGYVVVHTDPDNTAVKQTIEEKKDPILFGVIGESSKFYFIADWKDKLCDLTLKEIIGTLDMDKEDYTMDGDFGKIFAEAIG